MVERQLETGVYVVQVREGFKKKNVAVLLDFVQITSPKSKRTATLFS